MWVFFASCWNNSYPKKKHTFMCTRESMKGWFKKNNQTAETPHLKFLQSLSTSTIGLQSQSLFNFRSKYVHLKLKIFRTVQLLAAWLERPEAYSFIFRNSISLPLKHLLLSLCRTILGLDRPQQLSLLLIQVPSGYTKSVLQPESQSLPTHSKHEMPSKLEQSPRL